jgi:hypothetical protein
LGIKITIIIAVITASLAVIQIATAETQIQPEITCTTCHDPPESHVKHFNFPDVPCQTCHGDLSTEPTQLTLNHKLIISTNLSETSLDCFTCHNQSLGAHSNLGTGEQACLICHDNFAMQPHTLNGTLLTNATISNLCANCHREKYAEWKLGIHGTHGLNYTSTGVAPSCVTCHNPHIPDLPSIQTLAAPEKPERSTDLIATLLSSVMALVAGAVIVTVTVSRRTGGGW